MPHTTTRTTTLLDVDQAVTLAGDLLRLLAQHVGDGDAVNAHLARWADTLGPRQFGQVAMASVQTTFTTCLTPVAELPSDGIAYTDPTKGPR